VLIFAHLSVQIPFVILAKPVLRRRIDFAAAKSICVAANLFCVPQNHFVTTQSDFVTQQNGFAGQQSDFV
jgi:hypothetical protein